MPNRLVFTFGRLFSVWLPTRNVVDSPIGEFCHRAPVAAMQRSRMRISWFEYIASTANSTDLSTRSGYTITHVASNLSNNHPMCPCFGQVQQWSEGMSRRWQSHESFVRKEKSHIHCMNSIKCLSSHHVLTATDKHPAFLTSEVKKEKWSRIILKRCDDTRTAGVSMAGSQSPRLPPHTIGRCTQQLGCNGFGWPATVHFH